MRCRAIRLCTVLLLPAAPAAAQRPPAVFETDSVLRALVQDALARNPTLTQGRAVVRAAGARVRPAGTLSDPMLEAGVMDLTLPSFGSARSEFTEWDLSLSQEVPWPGTLGARAGVARAEEGIGGAAYAALRREIIARTAVAYYRLRYLATAVATVERQRRLLEAAMQLATVRYVAGVAPQSDALQAQLARERLASEEAELRGEVAAWRAALNALRDRASDDSVAAPPLDSAAFEAHRAPLPPAESLRAAALERHPDIEAGRRLVERNSLTIRLERLGARPDFALGLRYGYRGTVAGTAQPDFFSLFVGLRLPVWAARKQHQLVSAALADSAGAAAALRSTELDVARRVAETAERAEAGRRRLGLLVEGVVPAARATVESLMRSYQVGRSDFQALLAAEDTLYRAELEAAAVAAEHQTHLIMLRLLVAEEI